MKVKLLVGRAGTDYAQSPGEVVEVSNGEGARLIESGSAEPVVEDERETATASAPERRGKKKASAKKRAAQG